MSVIGYLKRCSQCEIQMLLTVEARHAEWCTDCLNDAIDAAIDASQAEEPNEDYPLGEVTG